MRFAQKCVGLGHCLPILLAVSLAACGGGGGGGGTAPAPATYSLSGTVSGLVTGTLVLAVTGKPNVNVTANGNVALGSGFGSSASYGVSVLTQPDQQTCTVTSGSGSFSGANVSSVQIACEADGLLLGFTTPENDVLVPVNETQEITAYFGGTELDDLSWEVLPGGLAANATVTTLSSTSVATVVEFNATVPGDYTLRLTSSVDPEQAVDLDLRVHQRYIAVDGRVQRRTYLQADGVARSETPGAPADEFKAIAQGHLYAVGVKTDGTVVSWGTNVTAPVPEDLANVEKVAAGDYFAVAIREDGTLAVWGHRNSDATIPEDLVATKFIAADATNPHIVAIQEDGTLVAWDADTGNLLDIPDDWEDLEFTQVCGTTWHVIALDESGTLHAWNATNNEDPELSSPPVTTNVAAIHCGSDQAALVQTNGRVMTWGVELGASGAFDSNTVSGFPAIQGAAFYSYWDPLFLTEGGAIIDVEGNLDRSVDGL